MLKKLMAVLSFAAVSVVAAVPIAWGVTTITEDITADTTWSLANSPYYLPNGCTITNATLTIEPGVVVKFSNNAGLWVNAGAMLNASGTNGERVYFTDYRDDTVGGDSNDDGSASAPGAGWWYGINVQDGGSANLEHATVRYAGTSGYANVTKTGAGTLTVSNSTISNGQYNGVYIHSSAANHSFTNSTVSGNGDMGIILNGNTGTIAIAGSSITGNAGQGIYGNGGTLTLQNNSITGNGGYGLYLPGSVLTSPANGNTVTGNSSGAFALYAENLARLSSNTYSGRIDIFGGTFNQDTTLDAGVPYVVTGSVTVNTGATLTAPAGAVVKFGSSAVLEVNGALNANGTNGSRVFFTDYRDDSAGGDTNGDGSNSAPGAGGWGGIYVQDGGGANLEYATLRYGGQNGYANVTKTGAGSLAVSNSTISNGQYHGVYIHSSAANHSFTNSTVSGNGDMGIFLNGNTGTIAITGSSVTGNVGQGIYDNGGTLTVQNNSITGNGGYGLNLPGSVLTSPANGNTVTGNGSGAFALYAENLARLSSNTYSGRIDIFGGTFNQDTTLDAGVPYVVTGSVTVDAGATLTVPAGTVVKFGSSAVLEVHGALNANGTSGSRVYFTDYRDDTAGGDTNGDGSNSAPGAGSWGGIDLQDGASANLGYATLRYGGQNGYANVTKTGAGSLALSNSTISNSQYHGVYIHSSAANHSFTNSTVSGNGDMGIFLNGNTGTIAITGSSVTGNVGQGIYDNGGTLTVQNNSITGNGGYGLNLPGSVLTSPANGNTVTGNSAGAFALYAENLARLSSNTYSGRIDIFGGTFNQDTSLDAGVPYVVTGSVTVNAGATLTVPAGTVVKFGSSAALEVNGALNANGTNGSRVYFTDYRDDSAGGDTNGDGSASSPGAGSWYGINVQDGASANLAYATMRYGGVQGHTSLYKAGAGSLTLSNSTISSSPYYGVYINSTAADHSITNSTVSGNGSAGIFLNANTGTIAITGSSITGNGGPGIYDNGGTLTVRDNTITGNGDYGIYLPGSELTTPANGNTVTGNAYGALALNAENLAPLSSNTLSGTIYIFGGNISQDTTLNAGTTYLIPTNLPVNSGATLTAPAGTVVKFYENGGLSVHGVLNATGTTGSGVYFTDYRDDSAGGDTNGDGSSNAPGAGGWYGISIDDGGSANLDHSTVRYGGRSGYGNLNKSGLGTLTLSNSTVSDSLQHGIAIYSSGGDHSITNSTVSKNSNDGIWLASNSGAATINGNIVRHNGGRGITATQANAVIQKNTIAYNNIGIYCYNATPLIGGSATNGNNIFGNTSFGVENQDPAITVDATYNWWGSNNGPQHATANPTGTGDKVSDQVDFSDYLTAPAVPIAIGSFTPAGHDFRHVSVGTTSAPQIFTAANSGNQSMVFGTVGLTGVAAGDYHITADSCSGKSIATGASCSVTVTLSPTAKGVRTARLEFPSQDVLSSPVHTAPLSGYGAVPLPFVENFAGGFSSYWSANDTGHWTQFQENLQINTDSADLYTNYTNGLNLFTLPVPSGIEKMMVTAKLILPSNPSEAQQEAGIILLREENKHPDLTNFIKTSYGFWDGGTRFQSGANANSTPSVFSGPPVSAQGAVWLRFIRRGTEYSSLYSTDGSTFTPLTANNGDWDTSYVGFFALQGGGSQAQPIPVYIDSFTVAPLPTISAASSAAFGTVSYQSAPAPQRNLTVANTGFGDLIIASLNVSGTDSALFSVGQGSCGPLPITIIPNGSCDLTVTLATSALGARSAALAIGSNDIDNPTVNVSLTGTLVDTTPPTVTTFTMPATSKSLTVALTALTATDNVAVTGYLITESAAAPVAGATGWSASKPASYTCSAAGARALYAWVKDAAGNVSASRTATVNIDTTAPSVSVFTLPANSNSLTVAITTLTATDNVGVTGYLLKESATVPTAAAAGWSATAPASYSFASAGAKMLYAWAKDAAGNVSAGMPAAVSVDTTPPSVTVFTVPAQSNSRTVAITALSATDNVAVTGYLVGESATASATATGWSATAPSSYTFSTDGVHTLYAFAKDAAGNVSAPITRQVTNSWNLTVQTAGTGSGTVTSVPAGIACASGSSSGCSERFTGGVGVNLIATPSGNSLFEGWSGSCSGSDSCDPVMNGNKTVTATFTVAPVVKVGTTAYPTLQAAYNAATNGSVLQMKEGSVTGSLTATRPVTVTIKGGYNAAYSAVTGETTLEGEILLRSGRVRMERMKVK